MPSLSHEPAPGEGPEVAGVAYGPLREVHPDRIVLASRTVYLPDGMTCGLSPGTYVAVVYRTDRNDRPEVVSVKQARPSE